MRCFQRKEPGRENTAEKAHPGKARALEVALEKAGPRHEFSPPVDVLPEVELAGLLPKEQKCGQHGYQLGNRLTPDKPDGHHECDRDSSISGRDSGVTFPL